MSFVLEVSLIALAVVAILANLIVGYVSIIAIKDELEYEVRKHFVSDNKSYWLFCGFLLLHILWMAMVVGIFYGIHEYFWG